MTVSRVLNGKGSIRPATRQKVLEAIARLGYRPSRVARSLTTRTSYTLGMVLPDIGNPFFPEIVAGVEQAAWQAGYSLMLCNSSEDPERERQALERLEDAHVDGVVLCSSRQEPELLYRYLQGPAPLVLVNRYLTAPRVASILVDDAYGTMCAVHHLFRTGHSAIAFVAGPEHSHSGQERRRGFVTAFETSGRMLSEDCIVACQPQEQAGYDSSKALLSADPKLTALLCYNDLVAIGALQAAQELGKRVPEDVAIIGCDNIRMASLTHPPLTTLEVDKAALGQQALQLLLELIQGKPPRHVRLKPQLIVRQSAPFNLCALA